MIKCKITYHSLFLNEEDKKGSTTFSLNVKVWNIFFATKEVVSGLFSGM